MKHLCSALLCCALFTGAFGKDPVIAGDNLTDDFLHLTLTKPSTWHFLTFKEKRDARKAVTYKNTKWDTMVKQNSIAPRIVISKYPEPYAGLNPTFTIGRYPLEEYRFKDGLWVAKANSGVINALVFTPILYLQPPIWREVAGKPAGHYEAYFDLEVKGLPTFVLSRRVWAISTPLAVLFITAVGPQRGPDASEEEFKAILQSLRFTP